MSETLRTPGMGLTPAEQALVEKDEAAWRKIEATPAFKDIVATMEAQTAGDFDYSPNDGFEARIAATIKATREGTLRSETRDAKASETRIEAGIEARIAAGEGHIPHPVTGAERAAAMHQAREQAFNASVSPPGYEDRRYAATSPTERFTL